MLIDKCPKCGEDGLRAETTQDMKIYYKDGMFDFEEDGSDYTVSENFYCIWCGATFALADVEKQAKKLEKGKGGK